MRQPQQNAAEVFTPSLPKGGGAIHSIGTGWGAIGMTGEASFSIPLPISAGRGFTPSLSLNYSSTLGNGPFGIGWTAAPGSIRRDTQNGVPLYTDADGFIGPSGVELRPRRNPQGLIETTTTARFNDVQLDTTYTVTRYVARVESSFDRYEHWASSHDPGGFWLIQGADGTLHVFDKTQSARCTDPEVEQHVAQWLLEESLNPLGEQIYYQYTQERPEPPVSPARDCRAQRYLQRICYGNRQHQPQLALWTTTSPPVKQWHFELVFDYGERPLDFSQAPSYAPQEEWDARPDPFFTYAYGFEWGSQRLCQQILMFHYFPDEAALGPEPVAVRRLLLEYATTEHRGRFLNAVHSQAFEPSGSARYWPPVEFTYSAFTLAPQTSQYAPFAALQGPGDGKDYQLVDLYSDGMPGVLYSQNRSWHYREPVRDPESTQPNGVQYGPLRMLPQMPIATDRESLRQTLADLNGDGQLEWIIAQPAMSGFFTLNARRRWSSFATFAALPTEFFHPQGQLADLIGNGVPDLALIGPRSVRLYMNQAEDGFESGRDVAHAQDDDALPLLSSSSRTELVAFSDMLGSGQQHLVRIRHNEIKCWPNLGHGRFGKGFVFAALPFSYAEFDAARVLLADIDGSGASDLVYLEAAHALIFMNLFGTGLVASPVRLPWPQHLKYDNACTVSIADLQGLGCTSLIVSMPHATPQHWRYDFVSAKPYLLIGTDNNMGAKGTLTYRSSAQEWLDEKQQRASEGRPAICGVPIPLHLVTEQQHIDAITGNRLTRRFKYREGFYNGHERKFQGFGFLLETDSQISGSDTATTSHTQNVLRKTWFHTGKATDMVRRDYFDRDPLAQPLGYTLVSRLLPGQTDDTLLVATEIADLLKDLNHALTGTQVRQEVYAARDTAASAVPYSVSQQRYLVRQVNGQASMLPLPVESISYRYERERDDPACQHSIHLRWDAYGSLTHGVTVYYARRKNPGDPSPYADPYQAQWWQDTHDASQQSYYLTESLAQFIHLDDLPQRLRLRLPYRQRTNALVLAKGRASNRLSSDRISYETFIDQGSDGPLNPQAQRTLGGLSVQHYHNVHTDLPYPEGTADYLALMDHVETAELDDEALKAYEQLAQLPGAGAFDLTQALTEAHYHRAELFLPDSNSAVTLWSIKKNFTVYHPAHGFYRAYGVRPTESHGVTTLEHDPYACQIVSVKSPDGCRTTAQYDYRLQLPVLITDPQGTQQQARYDAFGQLQVNSYFGRELGQPVGFNPLSDYRRPADDSPAYAIGHPQQALQQAASASFYTPFSWMGQIAQAALRPEWIAQGYVLPNGYIRASAQAATLDLEDPHQLQLSQLMQAAHREPVHAVVLQADRYPSPTDEYQPLIRISLTCSDGFGRTLQSKQLAPGGMAYTIGSDGTLNLDPDGKPISHYSETRWRVSSRVEYNNQGLAIRNYRPYFANHHRYINDASLRLSAYSDQVFYDALGRPTHTLNARGDLSRHTYCTWYTISEDENDTHGLDPDIPTL